MYALSYSDVVFVVEGQERRVKKDTLPASIELKDQQRNVASADIQKLPQWVTLCLFSKLERYWQMGDLTQIDPASSTELRYLMWLGDLLHLEQFL